MHICLYKCYNGFLVGVLYLDLLFLVFRVVGLKVPFKSDFLFSQRTKKG